ncbi:MAG: S41 family peptidase [Rhizobiales bacterium]|nr:S41 family peptidase [Hyphomicrobiales bacterium]
MLISCSDRPSKLPTSKNFNLAAHKGIWRSIGYGYLLEITELGMVLYDIDKLNCYKKPISSANISAQMTFFKSVGNMITISVSENSTRYNFTKLKGNLFKYCKINSTSSIINNFDYFTNIMSTHYAYFDLYQINWQKQIIEARAKIHNGTSKPALFKILSSMLHGLNDAHLSLNAEIDGKSFSFKTGYSKYLRPALDIAFSLQTKFKSDRKFRRYWFEKHKKNIIGKILSGQNYTSFNDRIMWGKVDNIGYINIFGMTGFSDNGTLENEIKHAKNAINEIMNRLKSSKAIIVDISTNSGGFDELGLLFASHFTRKQIYAYSKVAVGAEKLTQKIYIKPALDNLYLGEIFLITSDHTVSAAETFTLAMRAIKNVTHIGEITRGAFSDILDKPLPNGWELGLSNEIYRDVNGINWEGKGIPPSLILPIFRDKNIFMSHQKAINKIILMIKKTNEVIYF